MEYPIACHIFNNGENGFCVCAWIVFGWYPLFLIIYFVHCSILPRLRRCQLFTFEFILFLRLPFMCNFLRITFSSDENRKTIIFSTNSEFLFCLDDDFYALWLLIKFPRFHHHHHHYYHIHVHRNRNRHTRTHAHKHKWTPNIVCNRRNALNGRKVALTMACTITNESNQPWNVNRFVLFFFSKTSFVESLPVM